MPLSNGHYSNEARALLPFLKAPATYTSLIFVASILLLYGSTAESMIRIWSASETYTHGFLIVPIVLWLIWIRRDPLSMVSVKPCYTAMLPLLSAGAVWLIGDLAGVQVVQQLSLVLVLICGLWVIFGSEFIRILAFPLGYLFFAVPLGEGLIPAMMEFTATFTIGLLELTGIPVYREGLLFSIPSGDWSVVEACSGVRYLIASVALGTLYAFLSYQSLHKRILFISFSIIVPIIANGLRAYIIVMIGHLSSMRLAVGVDHLIYGWVFFGVIILLMFLVGSYWREPEPEYLSKENDELSSENKSIRFQTTATALCCAILVAGLWPVLGIVVQPEVRNGATSLAPGILHESWELLEEDQWRWGPSNPGADTEYRAFHRKGAEVVGVSMALYWKQGQGSEIINSSNRLVPETLSGWYRTENAKRSLEVSESAFTVMQAHLRGPGEHLLVWHWYRVGRFQTSNVYLAKIYETMNTLTGGRPDAARLAIATRVNDSPDKAAQVLEEYLQDVWPALESALDRAAGAGR